MPTRTWFQAVLSRLLENQDIPFFGVRRIEGPHWQLEGGVHTLTANCEATGLKVHPGLDDPTPPVQKGYVDGSELPQGMNRRTGGQEDPAPFGEIHLSKEPFIPPPPSMGQLDLLTQESP